MKCSICKQRERDMIWQPELQSSFYLPGYHVRGFMAVPVCEACKEKIKQGETVQFVYKKQEYVEERMRRGVNSLLRRKVCIG